MQNERQHTGRVFRGLPLTPFEVLKNIGHAVIVIDLDGTIFYVNKAAEEIFGYKSDEIANKNIAILYPEYADRFVRAVEHLEPGEILSQQWHCQHKDGARIWVDIQGKVIFDERTPPLVIIDSAIDIHERKELEEDLEESRVWAQVILDHSVEAIITINKQGIIQSFNKAAENMFGYQQDEVFGQNVNVLMPFPHREHHDEYLENYHATGVKKIIGTGREERGLRKDGTIFPMELSVSEVQWNGNTIYTGMMRDITKRRKLENEIIEASEEERRRIGQDLHDGLGQMLTGIGLISQNLANRLRANGVPGADEVKEISEMVKEADEYARSLSHSLVPIDVDEEGLRTAFKLLTRRAQKLFNIRCEFIEEGDIVVNRENISLHFYRIAQEAINNAVKHGNADHIKACLKADDQFIHLMIDDNGIGFSENFSYPKKMGLGVNTMRYRAHILGGNLSIDKNEQGWTRVSCKVLKNQQNGRQNG